MAWFKKTKKPITAPAKEKPSRVPEGLWVKCPDCAQAIYNKDLATNLNVCPTCGHHFRIGAAERLRTLFDGEWTEYDRELTSTDPLVFTDTKPYKARLKASIAATAPRRSPRSRSTETLMIGMSSTPMMPSTPPGGTSNETSRSFRALATILGSALRTPSTSGTAFRNPDAPAA